MGIMSNSIKLDWKPIFDQDYKLLKFLGQSYEVPESFRKYPFIDKEESGIWDYELWIPEIIKSKPRNPFLNKHLLKADRFKQMKSRPQEEILSFIRFKNENGKRRFRLIQGIQKDENCYASFSYVAFVIIVRGLPHFGTDESYEAPSILMPVPHAVAKR